jgi:hypothetical protein
MQMAIITSYLPDAAYGLLGPQMAATIIQDHTRDACIVIAVTRNDDKDCLKKALCDYFGSRRPVIGFSALSGREDLFSLAKELKEEGAVTILAGPQADADFRGNRLSGIRPRRTRRENQAPREGLQLLRCGGGQGISWQAGHGNGAPPNPLPAGRKGRHKDPL